VHPGINDTGCKFLPLVLLDLFFIYIYFLGGFFSFCSYNIQHCFICRSSDSTVLTDAGIEPRTVALALALVLMTPVSITTAVKLPLVPNWNNIRQLTP
jgi:hypothetical protein